jgi:Ni/Fe-hydrogenase b-type cytochrome subunit
MSNEIPVDPSFQATMVAPREFPAFAHDGEVVPAPGRVYRHPLPVRIWHWVNAISIVLLLLSGFQIFNAHPRLYIGHTGYEGIEAAIEVDGSLDPARPDSWIRIGTVKIPVTHVLGVVEPNQYYGPRISAFPSWLRLPSSTNLALGRGWHFMMAWVLVINLAVYIVFLLASRRFTRTLLPKRWQLRPRAVIRDLWMHLRLKHAKGAEALHYNLLQKLSYITIIFVILPLMVLTGMTMSNSAVAVFPWLIDLFGGRQTARLIHFVAAMALTAFVFIHVFQVFVAGFIREMRSIITGYYDIPEERNP